MKPHFFKLILLALTLGLSPAFSATVSITVNSNLGPEYATSSGSLLTLGDVVRVGYFDLSSPSVLNTLKTSNDFNAINALFTPLAEGLTNSGTVTQDLNFSQQLIMNDSFTSGHVLGQVEGIDENYIAANSRLSVWVFNSTNTSSATEWGIFSAASGWEFPSGNGSQTLSTFEIADPKSEVIRGFYDIGTDQLRLSSLSAVPEPGSISLLLAAGIMLRRRRR